MQYDALYGRQSVDRKDSISIESQLEFCRFETHGNPYIEYIDRGYSGKNTSRPGFIKMVNDIKAGLIQRVIVYKLDRISRSILDFANMIELFQKYGVEFVSSTEKFDTSTPIGRAMLNICIVFAQLERETIQKRVKDAFHSRCTKGYFMGGITPYGFKKVPIVMDGIHTYKFEQDPNTVSTVKAIYEWYSDPSCSLSDVSSKLNRLEIPTAKANSNANGGFIWHPSRIRTVLVNPIYAMADLSIYDFFRSRGVIVESDPSEFTGTNGCYYYNLENKKARFNKIDSGGILVVAPHNGIVDSETWLKCRKKLLCSHQYSTQIRAKRTWLAGKIRCGYCGSTVIARHPKYFYCAYQAHKNPCEGLGTLLIKSVEDAIFQEIKKKLSEFSVLRKSNNKENPEKHRLLVEKTNIENKISVLLDKVADADNALFKYINEEVSRMEKIRMEIEKSLNELDESDKIQIEKIEDYIEQWDELPIESKMEVVDALIHTISITKEKIQIKWKI